MMQTITSQVPYTSKARNAEHDYLFNKLVEAISKEFATKHNFLAYHQRMTAALADENASYTRATKYVDTDTLVQKDNARDNLFRRLKLHLQSAELDPDADTSAAAARCLEAFGSQVWMTGADPALFSELGERADILRIVPGGMAP